MKGIGFPGVKKNSGSFSGIKIVNNPGPGSSFFFVFEHLVSQCGPYF